MKAQVGTFIVVILFLLFFIGVYFYVVSNEEETVTLSKINNSVKIDEKQTQSENITTPLKQINSSIQGRSFNSSVYEISVLVLKYFPTKDDGTLDIVQTGDWQDPDVDALRQHVSDIIQETTYALDEGNKYHGYKDSSAVQFLDYKIYEEKEFPNQIPRESGSGSVPADHIKVLTQDVNICDYVENKGVKEVWVFMTHNSQVYPVESYQTGPGHSLGNGYMNLPVCKKSYTVYDYNYGREVGEAVEDHTHHIERIMDYVDHHIWWDLFTGGSFEFAQDNKVNFYDNSSAVYRCGWTHCPPNVIISKCEGEENQANNRCMCDGYNWFSERSVLSDCEDWKPDGSGKKTEVSCHTWSGSGTCSSSNHLLDGNIKFKIWWMQNIPGYDNGLTLGEKKVRNWWEFIADFDNAIANGKCLIC